MRRPSSSALVPSLSLLLLMCAGLASAVSNSTDYCTGKVCHGDCADACTVGDRLIEAGYLKTLLDWQNIVYLLYIVIITVVGRRLYRMQFDLAGAGLRGEGLGAGLKATLMPDRSDEVPTGPFDSKTAFFKVDIESHAVTISMAGFLFAVSMVGFSAITEFSVPPTIIDEFPYPVADPALLKYVGHNNQLTADGVRARLGNIGYSIVWMVIGLVLVVVSEVVTRASNSTRVNLVHEIAGWKKGRRTNIAAAVADAGTVIASGVLVSSTVGGAPREVFTEDLALTLGYFALSQLALFLYARLFDVFFITGNLWDKIKDDTNCAAAISHACTMISFSLVIGGGVQRSSELLSFGLWFVIGGSLQLLLRVVLDKMLLPSESLDDVIEKDANWGAALVIGAAQISIARVVTDAQPSTCVGFLYKPLDGVRSATNPGLIEHELKWTDLLVSSEYSLHWVKHWEYLLFLLLAVVVMFVGKLLYTLPFLLHAKRKGTTASFSLEQEIIGSAATDTRAVAPAATVSASPARVELLEGVAPPEPADPAAVVVTVGAAPAAASGRRGNNAVAISFAGYIAGVGIMYAGVFNGVDLSGKDFGAVMETLGKRAGHVGEGLAMMLFAQLANDYVVFRDFSNTEMLRKGNVSIACVEAGFYIATGMAAAALVNFDSRTTCWVLFAAHQVLLLLFNTAYEAATSHDDKEAISKDNQAHGINHGLVIVAFGLLLQRSLSLSASVVVLGVWTLVGGAALLLFRSVLAKLLFGAWSLDGEVEKGNWGAALIAGSVIVSLAQLLCTFMRECAFNEVLH